MRISDWSSDVCSSDLRKASNLPVIFLTSKDDEIDEVLGLRMGADDYITKPFSQRLLIERIRALLRRDKGGEDGGQPGEVAEAPLVRGELTLDPERQLCTWKGGRISLTVTEVLSLKALAQRPGHVDRKGTRLNTSTQCASRTQASEGKKTKQ